MGQVGRDEQAGLAAKLGRLFETMRPPGAPEREYTHDEVARGVSAAGGPTISATYVWMLRTGRRDNPTKHHLEALAQFFGVSPAYFFDEEQGPRIEEQLAAAAAMRDAGVRSVAMRASGLSPRSLAAVMGMLERVHELEGRHAGDDTQGDVDGGERAP